MGNKQKAPEPPPKVEVITSKTNQKDSNITKSKPATEVKPNEEAGYFNRPKKNEIDIKRNSIQNTIPEINYSLKPSNQIEKRPVNQFPKNESFKSSIPLKQDHPLEISSYYNTLAPKLNEKIDKSQEIITAKPNSEKIINSGNSFLSMSSPPKNNSVYSSTPPQKSGIYLPKPQETVKEMPSSIKTQNIPHTLPAQPVYSQPKSIYLIPKTNNMSSPSESKPINSPNSTNPGLIKQENPFITTKTNLYQNHVSLLNSNIPIKKIEENEVKTETKKPLTQYNIASRRCRYSNCRNSDGLFICLTENCKLMFCNEMNEKSESHIVYHINVTGHNNFGVISNLGYLHEIKCVDCNCSSIFHLGFLILIKKVVCKRDLYLTHNVMNEEVFFPFFRQNKIFEIAHLIFIDSPSPNFAKVLEMCQVALEIKKFQMKKPCFKNIEA